MDTRVLTHCQASCSGLARPSRSSASRLVAAPLRARSQRSTHRRAATAGILSRDSEAATLEQQGGLGALTEDELLIKTVHSPQEFQDVVKSKDGMVVLMCKAMNCRPCKLFSKKYAAAARQYTDATFLEIMGDETKETRKMMIDWKVKVTPTFIVFRNGEKVHQHGGINETQLHRFISKYLKEGEAGYGTFVEPAGGDE